MDFTALDFETANYDRVSACAVGAAVVHNGSVVNVFRTYIRPPSLEFEEKFTAIHGITPERVKEAPTFKDIWPQLKTVIGGGPIAAHNAPFDIGVLLANLEAIGASSPAETYFCTLQLARAALPGLPNHRLSTLASVFGIPLDHHDAGSDAFACARLGILLTRLVEPCDSRDYLREISPCATWGASGQVFSDAAIRIGFGSDQLEACEAADTGVISSVIAVPDGRFEGLRFAFTGELTFMSRHEASRVVDEQGGRAMSSVSAKTDFVVVGDDAWSAHQRSGHATGKLAKALYLQAAGASTKIIREAEFLRLCGLAEPTGAAAELRSAIDEERANLRHLREM